MFSRIKHFKVFLKDKNKKRSSTIFKELIQYGYAKRVLPVDYFRKYLYRKEITTPNSYLSKKEYYSIIDSPKILIPEIALLLDNKLSFALYAEKQNIPTPKLISYNVKHSFYYQSKIYNIASKTDLNAFFTTVFEDTQAEALFLKLINGIGGKGCILIEKSNLEDTLLQYGDTLLHNAYIHQEKINQHPAINLMHKTSVNTIRIYTYLDLKGESHIISALMRFGIGKSITDNTSSGGFYVAINMEKESLEGWGFQDVDKGGKPHSHHPDSHILLDGFKVPFFKEALELAKLAAKKTPTRIIGWDVAICDFGPIIIEGNTNPSLHMADVAYGGYCKHPIIKHLLNEVTT